VRLGNRILENAPPSRQLQGWFLKNRVAIEKGVGFNSFSEFEGHRGLSPFCRQTNATLRGMEDYVKMWGDIAARHEKEWKETWGNNDTTGPLVYWRDVVPYKQIVRAVRLKADQPSVGERRTAWIRQSLCGRQARNVQAARE
jgi:hypothetical protein